ncbi:MAG: methyltransferase family protein [Promethearchaeota archaeon]
MTEKAINRRKRILALIISGIYVVIILPIIVILVSLYIDSLFNFPKFVPIPINMIIAIILLVNGFFWAIWSNIELYRRGKGSPVPLKGTHTTVLVIKGPYKYTRNPMIFGYILIWIGLSFLINSIFLLLGFTLIIIILLIIFVKVWEEKNLEKRFGNSYTEYKKNVSFLFPLPSKKYGVH